MSHKETSQLALQYATESGRRQTTKEQVLGLLFASPRVSNHELAKVTPRYGARIFELRKIGFEIKTTPKVDGTTWYALEKVLRERRDAGDDRREIEAEERDDESEDKP